MDASRIFAVLLTVASFFLSVAARADLVKMSDSGLCHPPHSGWYERTQNYQAFDSVSACLDSGGELPEGLSRDAPQKKSDELQNYKRTAFGHGWDDADGDCQDSRAEALIATSTTTVRFATDRRCRVVTGRWISPLTTNVIQNASDIDIDHVVPLAWAWHRGANHWSDEEREQFSNDRINLWPVEVSLNRSKGAQGPNQWLPPVGECGYVARFVRIMKRYDLKPKPSETAWMQSFLNGCRN